MTQMNQVSDWTLEQVVGQLFSISVGHHTDGDYEVSDTLDAALRLVAERHVGGVCYFPSGEDGTTPQAIARTTRELQAAADVPLLLSIDQEGGLVARMQCPAPRWPSAMGQAAGGDFEAIRRNARASGEDLASVGINQVFAPVADVNTEPMNPVIGIRSASSSPEVVAAFVRAAIGGYRDARVASCLKHFPGHGNTKVDSHFGLPRLDTTLEQWEAVEAVPFVAGIEAGVDAVMIGHLVAEAFDPSGAPATFSRPIVTGLLRERLGFEGVIVTDALDMAGAQFDGGPGAGCVAALQAGVDQLLMPRNPDECIDAVLAAVRSGELDEEALRASASRLMALKERLRGDAPDFEVLHGHLGEAEDAVGRAVTWRDPQRRFTLEPGESVVIVADELPPSFGRGVEDVPEELAKALQATGHEASVVPLGSGFDTSGAVILVTRDAWRFEEVAASVRELGLGERGVAVAARSPYDAMLVDAEFPMLLTYGDIPGAAAAVAAVLTGGEAPGVLPIDLPRDASGTIGWPRRLELDHG